MVLQIPPDPNIEGTVIILYVAGEYTTCALFIHSDAFFGLCLGILQLLNALFEIYKHFMMKQVLMFYHLKTRRCVNYVHM